MEIFILAILLGLIPAFIAKGKGRSFWLWWFYGAGLFIVAFIHALLMKPDQKAVEFMMTQDGMKKCASCAEFIKQGANVCRYCGRDVMHPPA
jgi:hypothetical protein